MATTSDSIKRANDLEDKANILRNEIGKLNYEKNLLVREHKSTVQIDEKIKKCVDDLDIINNAFEVAKNELGDSYCRLGDGRNDRY